MHVDGKAYATFDKKPGNQDAEWPFHKPFYLILNLAIGGAWGRQKGIRLSTHDFREEGL